MKTKYTPKPIDLSSVKLSEQLSNLTEQMAKNVHEVWAAARLADGWIYGAVRNDALKTHPCLVPYEQLSESEKAYDKNTALSTLKLILKLGYTIKKE